jgi:hypothetical protein
VVLEIWPAQHYSPMRSRGGTTGVSGARDQEHPRLITRAGRAATAATEIPVT